MKKKIANAAEIVMLVITYIILWLPLIKVQHIDLQRPQPLSTSSLGLTVNGAVYIITILCIINIVMCLFSIFSKKEYRDGKMHIVMPIIMFFYMTAMGDYEVGKIIGEWKVVENNFPSTIILILMICVIAISIIKRSALIVGLPKVEIQNTSSNADELKKFKDLLDSGAITQAEFDEKKKQLLGL